MHKAKAIDAIDEEYDKPHRGEKSSRISSYIRSLYYIVDYNLGYWMKSHWSLYRRGILIFDRYYTDIIIDGRRSKIDIDKKEILVLSKFVPRLRYNFLLTADVDVILTRKKELTQLQIEKINENLRWLNKREGYQIVYNNDEVWQVKEKILTIILECQHKLYSPLFSIKEKKDRN